jgi:hypothetical protein
MLTKSNHTPRGEVRQAPAETGRRYIAQLQNMLGTARRMNNRRVIRALSSLIARRGGIA